ncbi:hypothetical protein [Actinomadura rupiterrae]|uniref:hypothetical protein n=1 Tax=Actinomadura rupiterrae TaxID=559627 RepID=UPI0020A2FB37|nr:hypothetical protein [Actinomadura rupiterrae]MCP2338792.1 hypothetical protein [Actinomadura rupiterrae]
MTTGPHDEHGETLRRALHAEAELVTPSADGLERIRARLAERERRRFPGRAGWEWFTANWTRPVLAVGAAVAIAGLGVSAPQTFDLIQSPMGNDGPFAKGHHGSQGGSGAGSLDSTAPTPGASTPGPDPSGSGHPTSSEFPVSSTVSPTCPPSPTNAPGTSPSHSPSKHPAAGKTGAPTCPTHSPTPSGSATPTTPSTPTAKPSDSPPPPASSPPPTHGPEVPTSSG